MPGTKLARSAYEMVSKRRSFRICKRRSIDVARMVIWFWLNLPSSDVDGPPPTTLDRLCHDFHQADVIMHGFAAILYRSMRRGPRKAVTPPKRTRAESLRKPSGRHHPALSKPGNRISIRYISSFCSPFCRRTCRLYKRAVFEVVLRHRTTCISVCRLPDKNYRRNLPDKFVLE
jgi:hypothetical protein